MKMENQFKGKFLNLSNTYELFKYGSVQMAVSFFSCILGSSETSVPLFQTTQRHIYTVIINWKVK